MYNFIVIADITRIIRYYVYIIEIILKSDVIINAEGGYVDETFNNAEKEAIQRYRVFIINFKRERIFVESERRIGNLMKVLIKSFTSNHFG